MSTEGIAVVRTASAPPDENQLRTVVDAYIASPTFPSYVHPSLEALSVAERTSWARLPKRPAFPTAPPDHDLSATAQADEEPIQLMYISVDETL